MKLEDDLGAGNSVVSKAEFAANSVSSHTFATPLFSGEVAADLLITTSAGNINICLTGYEICVIIIRLCGITPVCRFKRDINIARIGTRRLVNQDRNILKMRLVKPKKGDHINRRKVLEKDIGFYSNRDH